MEDIHKFLVLSNLFSGYFLHTCCQSLINILIKCVQVPDQLAPE